MRLLGKLTRLLRNLVRPHHLESSLDEELRAYIEEMVERNIRAGMGPASARRQALLEAGGLEQVKEEVRGTWLGSGLEAVVRDIRFAFRAIGRSPGFAAVVVLTLALGLGANVTMFSVMHAVLWRPLPYPSPERLVMIQVDAHNVANVGAAHGEASDLRSRSRLLDRVSTISGVDANLDYANEPEHLAAASVSDDLLPLLGAEAALGRLPNAKVDVGEMVRTVVISNELWRRRFGADLGVVGRPVRINNIDMQIGGVLRPGFRLFLPPSASASELVDIWFPTGIGTTREYRGYPLMARLAPGVTLAQANAELQAMAAGFVREHPESYPDGKLRITAHLLHGELTREARPGLLLLAAAVGFVLLIACVNVANLMLARGAARQRELAIRRALGAGSVRLIRQLLTESVVLAVIAGGAGLLLARIGLDAISELGNVHLPMQSRIAMDGPVTLFALGLSIGTSLLFGLIPAWRLASGGASDPLRAGRSETSSPAMRRLQRSLVVLEVALSIVPLLCGGLMLRTFVNLAHAPVGFDPSHVLTGKLPISFRMYPGIDQRLPLHREILERVGGLPGVEAVSAAAPLPFASMQITRRIAPADRPDTPRVIATQQVILAGYLKLVNTPVLEGRDFTVEDLALKRKVAIVDQRLARRLWPEGAIGRRLMIDRGQSSDELEIVGVTAPVRVTRVRDEETPHFFVPYHIYPIELSLVVKTRETAASLGPALRQAVDSAHPGRAMFDIRSMDSYVADSIGDARFTLLVLGVFAIASVVLASIGLYGTLAYLISQRTREFGIRLALGSTVGGILARVVREGLLLTVAGAGVGLLGASGATRAIRQLLYNVSPFDGLTILAVTGVVAVVALAAVSAPAWRATRIDPSMSLRNE